MPKVGVRCVLCLLSDEHMHQWMATMIKFLTLYDQESEAFVQCIVTSDETFIHHYTSQTEWQSVVWKWNDESVSKKFKSQLSGIRSCTLSFGTERVLCMKKYLLQEKQGHYTALLLWYLTLSPRHYLMETVGIISRGVVSTIIRCRTRHSREKASCQSQLECLPASAIFDGSHSIRLRAVGDPEKCSCWKVISITCGGRNICAVISRQPWHWYVIQTLQKLVWRYKCLNRLSYYV